MTRRPYRRPRSVTGQPFPRGTVGAARGAAPAPNPAPDAPDGVTRVACHVVHTTGLYPADRVVELGVAVLELSDGVAPRVTGVTSTLVDPGRPIPAEATAVHGVTDAMVAGAADFRTAWTKMQTGATVSAAHNAAFASGWIPLGQQPICTLKCARRLMPEIKSHSLDALVQDLNLPRPDSLAARASIGPGAGLDAWNVAWLLEALTRRATLPHLQMITASPEVPQRLEFGKHNGRLLSDPELPEDYLVWITRHLTDERHRPLRKACEDELNRRCAPDARQAANPNRKEG